VEKTYCSDVWQCTYPGFCEGSAVKSFLTCVCGWHEVNGEESRDLGCLSIQSFGIDSPWSTACVPEKNMGRKCWEERDWPILAPHRARSFYIVSFVYYVWGVSETIVFQQFRLLGVREKRRPGTRNSASGYEKNGVSKPDAYEKNGVGYERNGVGVREIRRRW
jgi:hypothetical protein